MRNTPVNFVLSPRRSSLALAALSAVLLASPIPRLAAEPSSTPEAKAAPAESLDDGLVASWPGKDSPRDVVGHHASTLIGGVALVPPPGRGFRFNGHAGAIFVPDFADLRLGPSLTLSAWINLTALGNDPGEIIFRGDDRPGLDPYALCVMPAYHGKTEVQFLLDSGTSSQTLFAPIPVGRTTLVTATLDDTTSMMRLYIDGHIMAGTYTRVRPFHDLDVHQNPGIGIGNVQDLNAFSQPFHGIIGGIRFYNRALSEAEVAALFTATKASD